ncbi:hypothetical protein J7384_00535 [Endozoicomonas sp. G2_1]|uniref:hypothetical protein n=1 Tax=Endozoicomonas sp. G2_1 TaxID=2821091 RepID=UPI001AD9F13F|nr:hypothetical protein [Endozoicomonas sp. G2_1]MBO9488841.1 hypothetical protein [Endozoicomonas sp. G2_1]
MNSGANNPYQRKPRGLVKRLHACLFGVIALNSAINPVYAQQQEQEQEKSEVSQAVKVSGYVIESQVQGSQEQPKVLYITPWQELASVVDIDDPELAIRLPAFKPIMPKAFKQKVQAYYREQAESK